MFLFLLLLCSQPYSWAQDPVTDDKSTSSIAARQKMLAEQAAENDKIAAELNAWLEQESTRSAQLLESKIDPREVDQAKLQVEARKVKLESIGLDITAAEQSRQELEKNLGILNDRLQTLASASQKDSVSITKTEQQIQTQRTLLSLEEQNLRQLSRSKQLAKDRLNQAQEWLTVLTEVFQNQQENRRQQSLEELQKEVREKRQAWEKRITELRDQLNRMVDDTTASQASKDLLETQLLEAEESIFLENSRLNEAQSLNQLASYQELDIGHANNLRSLKTSSESLNQLLGLSDAFASLLKSKLKLLIQRQEVIEKRRKLDTTNREKYDQASSILEKLVDAFKSKSTEIEGLNQQLTEQRDRFTAAYQKRKQKGLTERHRLPNTIEEWEALVKEIYGSPTMLWQISRNTLLSLWTALQQSSLLIVSLISLLSLAWTALCLSLDRLQSMQQPSSEDDFTHKASFVVLSLLRSNRFGLAIGGVLILSAWILDIVPPGLAVIGTLVGIWFGAKMTIGLSRWILKSPLGLTTQQPGLFRLIVVFTIVSSLSSLGLVVGQLGLLSVELTNLVERAFMLLLLPPAYLALRIRSLLIENFKKSQTKVYWVRLMSLTGFAIPLVILASAILGISGYINLGWSVASHLGLFILVLAGWLIARGLIIDLARTTVSRVEERSEHSALWIKGLIEPLHFLARLVLLVAGVWILYRLFVGDPSSGLDLKSWLSHALFTVGDTSITILNLLGSLLLLVMVIYIGRWAREITYGWLYGSIKDLGIRNSLSVFTQYAVVVIGLLVALNILGINLTSLTVFAGALGVGIGFGLQNIANNFISGLILLAERPVRSKDWVTIGDKEGEVSQIGMRSVTVTTWDNQDVIIPNSDLISNAFVNWTRSDNMVRTVLYIGIHYQADPHKAQKVIEEAVTMIPAVSLTPRPQVWMHEFGASSVDFRVQYHMDVKLFSRLEVKSQVMFAIWDALKEADIGIPYPQQDVYIKELPTANQPTGGLSSAT